MQDGLLEIRDLFGAERSFQVPDYQRAYAWGPTQLDEFLADLSGPMQGRPYFMGTFLFAEAATCMDAASSMSWTANSD